MKQSRAERLQRAVVTRRVMRVFGLPIRVVDVVVAAGGVLGTAALTVSEQAAAGTRIDFAITAISKGWLLVVGLGLYGSAAVWALLLRWRHERLERENQQLEARVVESDAREHHAWQLTQALMLAELAVFFKDNHLWSNERISFFIDDRERRGLMLVLRHSPRPSFVPGNPHPVYPYNQGCLGEAWDRGRAVYITNLPDPLHDFGEWQRRLAADWGIPPAVSRTMTMCARTIYAARIEADVGERPLGVVLIESVDAAGSGRETVERLTESHLADCVNKRKEMIRRLLELAGELRNALEPPSPVEATQSWTRRVASSVWMLVKRVAGAPAG